MKNKKVLIIWTAIFIGAMLLYLFTLAPDLVWQDQGDYQLLVAHMTIDQPGDVVRSHPLYIVLAHALGRWGIFSYAYAANLVSAFFGAWTVANVFGLTYLLVRSYRAPLLAAMVFAFSHSHWFLSVQAQTYSVANAMMTLALIFFLRHRHERKAWQIALTGLGFGLALSAHMMSQIAFVVVAVYMLLDSVRRKEKLATVLLLGGGWLIGAALLWIVMYREYEQTQSIGATIASALWGRWGRAVFNMSCFMPLLKKSVMFLVLNFPTPLLLAAAPGLRLSFKRLPRAEAWFLLLLLIGYALFALRYNVPNQNNFFLPMYIVVSVYIALGFHFLANCRQTVMTALVFILALSIIPTYPAIAEMARKGQISLGTRRHIPYRDEYRYYMVPWQQGQFGPRKLVEQVFAKVPQGSVLMIDSTIISAFEYAQQVEKLRRDITVMGFAGSKDLWDLEKDKRTFFTFSNIKNYCPNWAIDKLSPFPLSDDEEIYQIVKRH